MSRRPTIYKIYYDFGIAYIGITTQKLDDRLRGHFYKQPNHREIDIDGVVKIEYAETNTEADMMIYEPYLINKHKPPLNQAGKKKDSPTVELPPLDFKPFVPRLMDKWRETISERDRAHKEETQRKVQRFHGQQELRRQLRNGEITEDEYCDSLEKLENKWRLTWI